MNIVDVAGATEKRDAAFELKFLVPLDVAESALAWARRNMSPDPHVNAANGDGYRVNSLYFDTPSLDVYQRNGSYGKAKYRVRRYGEESTIYLERKLKARGLVSKRRTRIPDEDLTLLLDSGAVPSWVGYWFRRRLAARQLLPQCQIQYQRVARVGFTPQGLIRFTLDREVASFTTKEYRVLREGPWIPLLPDRCILELKFRESLPPVFESFIKELSLTPQPVSKYRLSVQVSGQAPAPAAVPAAIQGNGHAQVDALVVNGHTRPLQMNESPRGQES